MVGLLGIHLYLVQSTVNSFLPEILLKSCHIFLLKKQDKTFALAWIGFSILSTLQHTTASVKMCFDLIVLIQYFRQRWSPLDGLWPRRSPQHKSKFLALVSKVKSLASKPPSPQKCLVLGSRTALFFDLLKMRQGHDQFCFVLKNARVLAKIF